MPVNRIDIISLSLLHAVVNYYIEIVLKDPISNKSSTDELWDPDKFNQMKTAQLRCNGYVDYRYFKKYVLNIHKYFEQNIFFNICKNVK